MQVPQQVIDDLRYALSYFPVSALIHVRANRRRLVRGAYRREQNGCLFNLLSEFLPFDKQITSRTDLVRFFTGMSDTNASETPEYQPARWLVRLVDGQNCAGRYGSYSRLRWDDLIDVLDGEIGRRISLELEASRVQRRVNRTLQRRTQLD